MTQRPCLDCGRLIAKGYRCPVCQHRQHDPGGQRKSAEWRRIRAALTRPGARCANCGYDRGLQVHHEPDGRLTTLCKDCHKVETHG